LDGRIYLLTIVGYSAFERIQSRSLAIDFILNDNVIQNAVKVKDIFNVSFETFAIGHIFITSLFQRSDLTTSRILIELN
jgi:hypothetical protein